MADLRELRENNDIAAEFLESRRSAVEDILIEITANKGRLVDHQITYNYVKDCFLVDGLRCETFNCVIAYCLATRK